MNRDVVVLNDLSNGNAWLVDSDLRLVDNWEEVTPPEETDELEGDEKSAQQTFEDTLAERTDVNRPPLARDDEAGVRPGRTTVLEVLENDTDPDGDVLTVAETSRGRGIAGPARGDRRRARAAVHPRRRGRRHRLVPLHGRRRPLGACPRHPSTCASCPRPRTSPPRRCGRGAVSVEQGQQISYNVLADWNDPDGDDVFLVNASPTSGDSVRFSPDGFVTFDHKSGELGLKEVAFTVSDGQLTADRHAHRRRQARRHAEPGRHARLRAGVRRRDGAHRAARERPHARRARRSRCSASTRCPPGHPSPPTPSAARSPSRRTSRASTSSSTTSARMPR